MMKMQLIIGERGVGRVQLLIVLALIISNTAVAQPPPQVEVPGSYWVALKQFPHASCGPNGTGEFRVQYQIIMIRQGNSIVSQYDKEISRTFIRCVP